MATNRRGRKKKYHTNGIGARFGTATPSLPLTLLPRRPSVGRSGTLYRTSAGGIIQETGESPFPYYPTMRKTIIKYAVVAAVFFTVSFAIILVNQMAQLVELAARLHPAAGDFTFWLLVAFYAACVAVPIIMWLRLPRSMVLPATVEGPEFERHLRYFGARLHANLLLAGEPIDSRADIEAALLMLDKAADNATKAAASRVFVATAVSQNGSLDAFMVLGLQSKLVWEVAHIYQQRPSPRDLVWLYGNVIATAFVAGEIDDLDLSEQIQADHSRSTGVGRRCDPRCERRRRSGGQRRNHGCGECVLDLAGGDCRPSLLRGAGAAAKKDTAQRRLRGGCGYARGDHRLRYQARRHSPGQSVRSQDQAHADRHHRQVQEHMESIRQAPVKDTISFDILDSIDVRVGTIELVDDIEGSDKLLKLTVNFGDHQRTILAGMKQERDDPREIEGQQALFVVNLEPKKMMGEVSEGMLFDLGYADGVAPALAVPEKLVPDGCRAG